MTISQPYSGIVILASAGSELSCPNGAAVYSSASAINDDGCFQFFLDVSDMTSGDQLRIRVYEKCISGFTQRVVYESILSGPQGQPVWVCPSLILLHGWDFTIQSLTGAMVISWSIRKVA